jgi:hypothetical protein
MSDSPSHILYVSFLLTEFLPEHRFAETEGIVILTMLVMRYKIQVKEEPQFAGETFEQRKARVLANEEKLTVW